MAPERLEKMTKAELMKLAKKNGIKVTTRMLKAEMIAALKKALSPAGAAKAKAKKAAARPKAAGKVVKAKKAAVKAKAKKASPKAKKAPAARKPAPGKKAAARRKPASPAPRPDNGLTIRQKAIAGKYHLTTGPKAMPPVDSMDIPPGYNLTRIVVMVRDPHWLFSYWEITEEKYRELERGFGSDWTKCRMVLRVHDRSRKRGGWFDIETGYGSTTWYINVEPGRPYQVAVGIIGPDGRFVEIAISNIAETPAGRVSDIVDDKWLMPEDIYERIFAASGGYDIGPGASAEMRELLEARLIEEMGSEAVSSFSSAELQKELRKRGFRLWVAAELILYGATEPDAHVTIQGKEIKLRGDGTFSTRFALPDGTIDIPVTAVSGDRVEERTIETSVRKKSKQNEPVIR